MERRLQKINGDTVLEITDSQPVKTRLSRKDLERRRDYLEEALANFSAELAETEDALSQIDAEETKAKG